MRKKQPIPFSQKFPNADPLALRLLQRLLSFDPKDRPTAEEVGAMSHYFFLFHWKIIVFFDKNILLFALDSCPQLLTLLSEKESSQL